MADSRGKGASIHTMIEQLRSGGLSRREFIAGMTALGVTAAGAATVLATVTRRLQEAGTAEAIHFDLHEEHVARQLAGDTATMMDDYAPDATVDDPLFDQPFVGKEAISRRYAAEVASVPDRQLRILNRTMAGDQLVVEWEATGTHAGDFLGFGGTGRTYTLRGTTVIVRRDGKIVRESHYYDVDTLHKQVCGTGGRTMV
ncbi:MAG TPA: nuclear transport factor 2 family protein [Ktedonobacterales bacterium]|nr:nuclear transport factor 2 family protein [Ktedonobacterales bacterium]